MLKVIFLPHKILIPSGGIFHADIGESILDIALKNNINIQHACEKSCACSTCHCIIEAGCKSLSKITEKENDVLDKVMQLEYNSRLSCQAKIINNIETIKVKIPLY
ncbi:2Fe-2S iron-sulfur cluster-binding protein [Buchnera aphidicola]|uniref:2Fe-2S iron-sulfur cluster-binding protein n=1 Tax=Buchnera aphidicola TaxID=9 RepID=UPI00346392AC